MTTHELILVTGATGNVGRGVVASLLARGARVRAAARTIDDARRMHPDAEPVALDLADPVTWPAGLDGVRRVFLLRPPAIADVRATINVWLDRATEAGVEHVTLVSVAGAERLRFLPHARIEQHLQRSPVGWTFLRPGFFAQNLGDAYRRDIAEDDRVIVPAGRGRAAFVDVRDVAEVAALSLLDPAAHRGAAYTLTGPEALSFDEVADILTAALRRPIAYRPASILGYLRHLRGRGLPWAQALVQTALHVGLRFGQAERVEPTLEDLLGRRPRTLAEYVRDHVGVWM